jgi:hypothetical protein
MNDGAPTFGRRHLARKVVCSEAATMKMSGWRLAKVMIMTMTLGACGGAADDDLVQPTPETSKAATATVAQTSAEADVSEDAESTLTDTDDTVVVDADGNGFDAFAERALASGCSVTVNTGRELMIRALGVVEDPVRTRWTGSTANASDGAWSFGRLMKNMAGTNDARDFVRAWLGRWQADRTVNGFTIPARTRIKDLVIDPWPKDANGKLDLTKAPLRLLAIVNRMDLRNLAQGNAGEGRFVFGVVDRSGNPLSFTVILEYKLPATTVEEATSWANAWHGLGALTPGSAEYNAALQAVTDRFARKNAAPGRPNGSAIGQIRTNEIALAAPWELREFRINSLGKLGQATTIRTPAPSFRTSAATGRFINANESRIMDGTFGVPLKFEDAAFRGGRAPTDFNTIWNPPGVTNPDARHLFSVNTCNGCHGGETQTAFLHVGPRARGQVAPVSTFLTGKTVTDPVSGTQRSFADLDRRRTDLANFLCAPAARPTSAAARTH